MLIGLSYEDESMSKHYEWTSLVRIYWTETPQTELCIESVTEVVNSMYQKRCPTRRPLRHGQRSWRYRGQRSLGGQPQPCAVR